MDPLSIVGTSFALAGALAKTGMVLAKFSREFRACADDLGGILNELQAIATILDPLTRVLSRSLKGGLPESLFEQVDNTMTGCVSAVAQVEGHIQKYQHDKIWTKAKWVVFGQEDMQKLRDSLEVYKMALNIGLQAVSLNLGQDIKDDTEILRTQMETVKFNTDEILARIKSVRETGPSFQSNTKVSEWIENMAILSTYAESTYKDTILDAAEFTIPPHQGEGEIAPREAKLHTVQEWPRLASSMSRTSKGSDKSDAVVNTSPEDHLPSPTLTLSTGASSLRIDEDSLNTPTTLYSRGKDDTQAAPGPVQKDKRSYGMAAQAHHPPKDTRLLCQFDEKALQNQRAANPGSSHVARPELTTNGVEDMKDMKTVSSLARPNLRLIREAHARRALLSERDREWLDIKIIKAESGLSVRDALFKGADPNTRRHDLGRVMSLLYVWALVAAGAEVNPGPSAITCPKCAPSFLRTSSTPLLCAIEGSHRSDTFANKIGIVRFLSANGADPNSAGCEISVSMSHQVHSPVSTAMTSNNVDLNTSVILARILFDAGAIFGNMGRLPLETNDGSQEENPIYHAIIKSNRELLLLLSSHIKPSDSPFWKQAVSCAVMNKAWDCVDLLTREPYVRADYLHTLVNDYMSQWGRIDGDVFWRVVKILIATAKGQAPSISFTYRKKKKMFRSQPQQHDLYSPPPLGHACDCRSDAAHAKPLHDSDTRPAYITRLLRIAQPLGCVEPWAAEFRLFGLKGAYSVLNTGLEVVVENDAHADDDNHDKAPSKTCHSTLTDINDVAEEILTAAGLFLSKIRVFFYEAVDYLVSEATEQPSEEEKGADL
ncbi:hypothetical protein AK830_g283 [Neonectria ditissima]|uniref:Azaphilone pigments biosynthesis cluster protein L N-terminal domain-containing protein n=1 Tax=Neonectria ditissima TaxID=78410 RepID=A0A0P7B7Q5_9HYPO|nr:hypothetical protein AK830_g283 [Neonectria ditissima]